MKYLIAITLTALTLSVSACDTTSGAGGAKRYPVKTHSSHTGSQSAPASKPKPHFTTSQQQAIGSAQDYLSDQAFSKAGLISQLDSKYGEGFKRADAVFAVNHIRVNWRVQAAKSAKSYLADQHFSRAGLISQLDSKYGEQFTHAQAVYGVNQVGLR